MSDVDADLHGAIRRVNQFAFIKDADDLIEIYKILRDYIVHEDSLVDRRTTWNILIQSLLLASLAAVFAKFIDAIPAEIRDNLVMIKQFPITKIVVAALLFIAFSGFLVNLATIWGVSAAGKAIVQIEQKWDFIYHNIALPQTEISHNSLKRLSHSHRNYGKDNETLTLPVPYVTGGHKPRWKKDDYDLINSGKCQNKKSGWGFPAVAGRLTPIFVHAALGLIWIVVMSAPAFLEGFYFGIFILSAAIIAFFTLIWLFVRQPLVRVEQA